jgi:hypothetical protein
MAASHSSLALPDLAFHSNQIGARITYKARTYHGKLS